MAGAGLVMHMSLVYVTSYFHKSGPEWKETGPPPFLPPLFIFAHPKLSSSLLLSTLTLSLLIVPCSKGDAVYYALSLGYFQLPMARFLLTLPMYDLFLPISTSFLTLLVRSDLLRMLGFATLAWELFGVLFLFSPFYSQQMRLFGTLAFWAMHSAFGFGLRIGINPSFNQNFSSFISLGVSFLWLMSSSLAEFYFYPMAAFIAFFPPLVWDSFLLPHTRTAERLSLRYFSFPLLVLYLIFEYIRRLMPFFKSPLNFDLRVAVDPTSKFGRSLAFVLREVVLAEGSLLTLKPLAHVSTTYVFPRGHCIFFY